MPASAGSRAAAAGLSRPCHHHCTPHTAGYTIVNSWQGGFQGEVKVTAGPSAITGWTVRWTFANGQTVSQTWNATISNSGAEYTARNVDYNGRLGAGASTSFGFLGSWNSTNTAPTLTCTPS
ncbi:cellulose binding domain-containing protein [Micromonospora sp. NPDC047740]|uniref:cellulose binding domain-containing protein n=1 Tax=Micromonospora sp. NPDC047740 TaxID=3364254 RepID=UPI003714E82E